MTRYKNLARLEQEEKELQELENAAKAALNPQTEEEEDGDKPLDAEEQSFKKRYGDLRRHLQQKEDEAKRRIEALEAQLADATKKTVQFPKTEEEFNAWADKYPDVVANIKTMIMKHSQELEENINQKLKKVQELEIKSARDEAIAELHRLHPDFFAEIRPDPKFQEWIENQPKWIKDALWENDTDAYAAARAIDLYKADMGLNRKKKEAEFNRRDAAETVVRPTTAGPDLSSERPLFKESQVQKMTAREYERFEDDIMKAIRDGRFEYDISGGAR